MGESELQSAVKWLGERWEAEDSVKPQAVRDLLTFVNQYGADSLELTYEVH